MAGPAIVVVGCVITIVLALDGYGVETVNDGGAKHGLVVTKDMVENDASIQVPASVE